MTAAFFYGPGRQRRYKAATERSSGEGIDRKTRALGKKSGGRLASRTSRAASPPSRASCRGFVTSDVMDDFVGVGLRESIVSELGIVGTKINTDLPRFGPSM